MNIAQHTTDLNNITFIPVMITRGRKFKGFAYMLGRTVTSHQGFESSQLWDPATKTLVYATPDFCQDTDKPTTFDDDLTTYVDTKINGTIDWCRKTKAGASDKEVLQFARNIIRKYNPELVPFLEDYGASDQRDVAEEVEKTLNWAMQLKTRPCWMYGKWCAGGKPLADERKLDIAWKSLHNKSLDKLVGFAEAWELALTLRGLMKYFNRYM